MQHFVDRPLIVSVNAVFACRMRHSFDQEISWFAEVIFPRRQATPERCGVPYTASRGTRCISVQQRAQRPLDAELFVQLPFRVGYHSEWQVA